MSTLRFGERAKKIKNKPKINKEVTVEELQKIINQLTEKIRRAEFRISELESFIASKGLVPPEGAYEFEEGQGKKGKSKEKERVDEAKLFEEIKERLMKEGTSAVENIGNVIGNLEDNDDVYENKWELISTLKAIKEQMEENENNDKTKIKSLEEELTTANEIKGKLQETLIINETKYQESSTNKKILENLKKGFQNSLSILKSETVSILTPLKDFETTAMQTEKFESEIEIMNEKFLNQKRLLLKSLDEKDEEIQRCILARDELSEKVKNLESTIPLNEREIKSKNSILESNLKDLRKKYERMSGEKLLLENSSRALKKALTEKVSELEESRKEIADLKEKISSKNQQGPANMVRVIQGGNLSSKFSSYIMKPKGK